MTQIKAKGVKGEYYIKAYNEMLCDKNRCDRYKELLDNLSKDDVKIGGIGPIGINIDTYKHLIPEKDQYVFNIPEGKVEVIIEPTTYGFVIIEPRKENLPIGKAGITRIKLDEDK